VLLGGGERRKSGYVATWLFVDPSAALSIEISYSAVNWVVYFCADGAVSSQRCH